MEDFFKKLDILEKNIKSLTIRIDELLKENMRLRNENKIFIEKERNYISMLKKLREMEQEKAFLIKKLEKLKEMIDNEIEHL